jgi:hypothetical protein
MEEGKTIELKNVATYFGSLSLLVNSNIDKGFIEATIECNSDRKPEQIMLRIPHPTGKKPVKITGGIYDYLSETVSVTPFTGKANIKIEY